MRLTDGELQAELRSAKVYLAEVKQRECKRTVIRRAEIQVNLLEELVLWRENGKKWLDVMKEGENNARKVLVP